LDVGTSSARASLYDGAGHPVPGRFRQVQYEPTVTRDGGVEHDAARLLEAVAGCLDGVLAGRKAPIRAVGVTTFWHGLLGFDGGDRPATPIYMWSDTRSVPDARLLGGALDRARSAPSGRRGRCGGRPPAGSTGLPPSPTVLRATSARTASTPRAWPSTWARPPRCGS